jgi:alcohol dehydrogenase
VLAQPGDLDARSAMLLGSHFAGVAIEQSMLGAAHACSNPLTARFGLAHGLALSIVLPHVVRWNASAAEARYATLAASEDEPAERLARDLEELGLAGGLGGRLRDRGVTEDSLPELAQQAATQWTGTFNPRPFDAGGALEIYRTAY